MASADEEPVIEELEPERAGSPEEAVEEPVLEEVEPGLRAESSGAAAAEEGGRQDGMDDEMRKIEQDKESLTATEKLERAFLYKVEGNEFFKQDNVFSAADCYYRAVLYARDLMQSPKYYPKLGHTEAQQEIARGLVEGVFCNLALVQSRYGLGLGPGAEREKVLREAGKSAGEALKVNGRNAKALYRRGLCRGRLSQDLLEALAAGAGGAELREAQELCAGARADLLAAAREDGRSREARAELKAVQELARRLKQEEARRDRRAFSFEGSLSALAAKEEDLLGDGTVRKQQVLKPGDGARWFSADWLRPESRQRCVVHVRCRILGGGGAQLLAFALGDPDMHEGIRVAVRSLSKGEAASFALAPGRLQAEAPLALRLPRAPAEESSWELELLRFGVYDDLEGDGSRLLKVHCEGYGHFPEALAECHLHWKVTGPDDRTLHSSRYTVSVGGAGGIEQQEDPERAPYVYVLGETTWEPVAALCRALRQGGRGELRLKRAPALPERDPGAPADAVTAQLSAALGRRPAGLEDCAVFVELERVLQPVRGPEDGRWAGVATLVEERFRAEQLLEAGEDAVALVRLRRACEWAERAQAPAPNEQLAAEAAALRAGLAWVLAKRAAPILDLGTVSSHVLRAAEADLAEAEAQCSWLEEHCPGLAGTLLVRAKLLVARDDDFEAARAQLLEAQRLAPADGRVQQELRAVRAELQRQREALARERLAAIREGLQAAREQGAGGDARAAELLAELAATDASWEAVTETRIGAELKRLQEASTEPRTRELCLQILGRWMDQSKQQRPMWER